MRLIHTSIDRPASTRARALQLGYMSLIPFFAGALVTWGSPGVFRYDFAAGLIGWVLLYGAIYLSFMSGARWGLAIRDWRPDKLLVAILPVLLAWVTVVPQDLTPGFGLADRHILLAVAFFLQIGIELLAKGEWSPWYRLYLMTEAFLVLTILGLVR